MQIKECIVLSWAGSAEPAHRFANPQKTTIFAEKPRHLATEGTYELHYIHKDHLGSWTTITDAGGQVIAEQSFDAWGNMRDPETWSCDYNNTPMFDRGFTGHEHLHMFGLINMNGRVYDPVMSTFLSPDNYIQAPDNSQNFNRYAYCLNNPLKYTDPSGWQMVPGLLRKPETRTYTPPGPLVQVQSDLNWWLTMAGGDMLSGGLFSSTALAFGTTSYFLNFPNTEAGYDFQKTISPVAFKLNYGFGSRNHIGLDVSLGLPGLNSYRWHCGASYYFGRNIYGNYNSWETRTGSEIRIMGVLSYSGTKFTAGSYSQITNKVSMQVAPFLRISYENDFMWNIGSVLGPYAADKGDRWRSAAVRINWGGVLEIGTNLFTGDPGHDDDYRDEGAEEIYDANWNQHYYYTQLDALNPDQRAGVLYVGFGNLRFGRNSESIRHAFQNRFAHDRLTGGDAYWFLPLDIEPSVYFQYGTGTGDTLW